MQKSSPGCKDGKILNLAAARIMDAEVLIARYKRADWEAKIDRAIQQYTFCLVQFFGDERGAECQARQEQLMRYKSAWEAADLR